MKSAGRAARRRAEQPPPRAPARRLPARRALLLGVAWVVVVLLAGELSVRALGRLLRRDTVVAPATVGAGTIYCIGDSFTYGQGVKPEEAWPQVLARRLREAMPERTPRVRTLAEPGRSSSVALVELAHVLEAGDAQLVLLMTGWNANDGDFAAHRQQAVPWSTRVDMWLEHSRLYRVTKQALTVRGRTLVFDDVKIIPQTTAMSLYDFRAYQEIALGNLRQMARMCRAAGVPCAFLTYPHQPLPPNPNTRLEYYHALFGRTPISKDDYLLHDRRPDEIAIDAVIRHVAESEGLPLIDLQPAFERPDQRSLFLADYHHPTPGGHALIAGAVFDAIHAGLAR
jgi:lysophospholipase L1-like esterase